MKSLPVLAALAVVAAPPGCSSIEDVPPRPRSSNVDRSFELDVPMVMRGTVASQAVLLGYREVLVRGYGLVVGLNGTGSRDVPPDLRGFMLQEMARRGVGSQRYGRPELRPEQMLDSPDTAVVIVEGIIPPGAVKGTTFNQVRVFADPRTSTTSLEGGRLYTTDLRPMAPGEILPRTGGKQAFSIATAAGPIFVNPFKAAGPGRDLEINHTSGRVLGGGTVTRDIPVKLRLARPSHVLASLIERAINTRFPQEPGQRSRTAHGESEESIEIHVPPSYRDRTREFMQLVQHTTIQQMAAERVAINVRRVLEADPSAANDASWRWQALGARTIPIIRDLYDHPGEITRLAALRAGAGLDDPLIVPHLIDTARQGAKPIRLQAIRLLTDLRLNPQIDVALRPLLNDPDVDVRLGAYEALSDRGDPAIGRVNVEGKFVLEVVESDYPMIYVTQFGSPRVVLFGSDLALERPLTAQAWSNRLIVKEAGDGAQIEVFYRPPGARQPMIETISANLDQFIEYLAHTSTATAPEPGLGLSYGHTIGAIYQIYSQGYIKADFKAEQDRILAAIMDFQRESTVKERPEFADPDFDIIRPEAAPDGSTGSTTGGTMQPVPTAAAEQAPGASAAGPGRP